MGGFGDVRPPLVWGSPPARWTLAATVVASGVAFLDSSLVTVALPQIGDQLGGGFATLQWVLDGYLLTLGSLVLVGGALADLLGRRRVFVWGIVSFAATSLLCGLAWSAAALVIARLLQGVAAALLVPGSLAILQGSFEGASRGRAIGAWSGLSSLLTAAGPIVGGVVVQTVDWGWRLLFVVNPPLLLLAWWLTRRGVPELPGRREPGPLLGQLDLGGAVLAVTGLGLLVFPLIEADRLGTAAVVGLVTLGLVTLAGFVVVEACRRRPMLPPALFRIRSFTVANIVTLVVYGALGVSVFLLVVHLQQQLGYGAAAAGASGVPVTAALALFSSRVGALVSVVGARLLLTVGPLLVGLALLWLSRLGPGSSYWSAVLLPMTVFAAGMVLVVAPVTTTALADIPGPRAGVASGVNNAIARVGSLLAIAALPLVGTLGGVEAGSDQAYARTMVAAAVLCGLGALAAAVGLPSIRTRRGG